MEKVQHTLVQLSELFESRMSAFQAEIEKIPNASSSATGLAAEFSAFRTFIMQAMGMMQQQVEVLARGMDAIEMRGRRKILLLHGVTETKNEDTAQVVTNIIKSQLQMGDFKVSHIKRCHRMGQSSSTQKPRPILFKLMDVEVRDNIWFSKTKFKGSGMTVSEFLTKARHDIFLIAREKFGVNKCWTRAGTVYVLGPDGSRHRVTTLLDLNRIEPQESSQSTVAGGDAGSPVKTTAAPRSKRTGTKK